MSGAAHPPPHAAAVRSWFHGSRRIGIVTLLGVGAVALFMAYTAWPVVASVFAPSAASGGEGNGQTPAGVLAASMANYKAQVDGRSLFFIPRPKHRDLPPADAGPRQPAPPASYGGPPLIAMINGAAWFNDGRKLVPGAEADRGLRVISIDPPWGARVQWQGVEFTIPLFNRDALAGGGSPSTPAPDSAAPAGPKPPAPAAKPSPEKTDRPEDAPPDAAPSPPPDQPSSDSPAPKRPAANNQPTAGTENR